MSKVINAYVLIDTIVRQNGIEPIEEGLGACWRLDSQTKTLDNPPGFSIMAQAIDFRETGLSFGWSLEIFRLDKKNELDAEAKIHFGAEVEELNIGDDDDGASYYPHLELTYSASKDAWTLEFGNCFWNNGAAITTAAKLLGLAESNVEGIIRVLPKVLSETEAREAIVMLARHVKEYHIG